MRPGTRHFAVLYSVVLAALSVAFHAAPAEPARPYQVEWPEGWEIADFPQSPMVKQNGGGHIALARRVSGHEEASFDLIWLPISAAGGQSLEAFFHDTLEQIREIWARKNKAVVTSVPQATTLGTFRALQSEVKWSGVKANGEIVNYRILVTVGYGHDYTYLLQYSGHGEGYGRNFPAFDEVRRKIVLK